MGLKMSRGKRQIIFNYLPGYTFDFDKSSVIAQVDSIRGIPKPSLNIDMVLKAIEHYVSAWLYENPRLLMAPLRNLRADSFVLLEPKRVNATLFPKVLWCQNSACGRVFDYSGRADLPSSDRCPACGHDKYKLKQLRFIKVHRCGNVEPLIPPYRCRDCGQRQFALDTRGSERIGEFRWICRNCGNIESVFGGYCNVCNWEDLTGDPNARKRQMNIDVHRARRTYYPHHVVLLNQPGAEMNAFLSMDGWEMVAAGKFLGLPELENIMLMEFTASQRERNLGQSGLSDSEIEELRARGYGAEQIEQFVQMQAQLEKTRAVSQEALSPDGIGRTLASQTGVQESVWREAGQEMLEAVLPIETGDTLSLAGLSKPTNSQRAGQRLARRMSVEDIVLATDFPITLAALGYSRVAYEPPECRLNTFPADADHQGKFPIFVDLVQADAIIVSLNARRIWDWLEINGFSPTISAFATNLDRARRAHFVEVFDGLSLRQPLTRDTAEARMVFGLLHSMSHVFVRRAALLCGLDRTSLSEYVLPKALTFAIYSNHRFGATIGALVSLFEQSIGEWLDQVFSERQCVYDPVCYRTGGNCHACIHLAETSCRFFNLNLSRAFLFGGEDQELGTIKTGYFELDSWRE